MSLATDSQSGVENSTSLRVLVVDDDVLNQRLMKALLSYEGHQVNVASNGLEAFDAVKFEIFDIVFMDLQMPIMDGMEASRRIREWENGGRHTFIVALTASYLPEEGQMLFEAGIDNYISKPFQLEHIRRLLNYSAAAHSLSPLNHRVTFPEKLSSAEILAMHDGVVETSHPPTAAGSQSGDLIE